MQPANLAWLSGMDGWMDGWEARPTRLRYLFLTSSYLLSQGQTDVPWQWGTRNVDMYERPPAPIWGEDPTYLTFPYRAGLPACKRGERASEGSSRVIRADPALPPKQGRDQLVWDSILGVLESAGCRVSDFLADDGLRTGNPIVAGPPQLYDELVWLLTG